MTSLQTETFSRPTHISMKFVELLQNVVAFVSFAGLQQRSEFFAAPIPFSRIPRGIPIDEHRQMTPFDPLCLRIENQDALDKIAQFTDISRPVILLQRTKSIFGHLNMGTTILRP